jgi:hypothetical protein
MMLESPVQRNLHAGFGGGHSEQDSNVPRRVPTLHSAWVYEGTLKIEYQTTALSLYSITFQPDHKYILDVKNPRRIETHFRSPQLDLWQLSETSGCWRYANLSRKEASGVEHL